MVVKIQIDDLTSSEVSLLRMFLSEPIYFADFTGDFLVQHLRDQDLIRQSRLCYLHDRDCPSGERHVSYDHTHFFCTYTVTDKGKRFLILLDEESARQSRYNQVSLQSEDCSCSYEQIKSNEEKPAKKIGYSIQLVAAVIAICEFVIKKHKVFLNFFKSLFVQFHR